MISAKEWLEKEGFIKKVANLDCETETGFGYPLQIIMERFANNRTAELQAKILGFRKMLYDLVTLEDREYLNYLIQINYKGREDNKIKDLEEIIKSNPIIEAYEEYFEITKFK